MSFLKPHNGAVNHILRAESTRAITDIVASIDCISILSDGDISGTRPSASERWVFTRTIRPDQNDVLKEIKHQR